MQLPETRTFMLPNLVFSPIGVDAGFVTAIAPAEEAVLVTTPDITALRDADRVAGLLECDGIKDIKIIVNRVRPDLVRGEDMMSALDVQEMLGLPLLGVVPEDSEVIDQYCQNSTRKILVTSGSIKSSIPAKKKVQNRKLGTHSKLKSA